MLRRVFAATTAIVLFACPASAQLKVQPFVTGLSVPVAFIQDPTDATVQYVVQQNGHVRVVKSGVVQATDFLDVSTLISTGGERGLLGLAFEPGDPTDRRFYVNYTNTAGHTVIARYLRSTGNRLIADGATGFALQWNDGQRVIVQPYANHNGGTIAFGPDGYLYIGMGDGGSGNDPERLAQNPNTLLGKILRIDVRVPLSNTKGYVIPADNPFLDNVPIPALGEIWSFGLRNPWKFSFDDPTRGGTGGMLIGDVGQGLYEEVDYEPPNQGGRNYGWVVREGAHPTPGISPPPGRAYDPLIDPIHEYTHADGISITGGYVYRGAGLGSPYVGRYFFADLTGRVWSIGLTVNPTTGEATASGLIEHTAEFGGTSTLGNITSFGVDSSGELYIVGYSKGTIFRVESATPLMTIDGPAPGIAAQPFSMGGWAIDRRAASGPGVDVVHLWALPSVGSPIFLGAASSGGSRPDVGAIFGSQFTNSGYNQTIRGLRPGNYVLTASSHSSVTGMFVNARAVSVTVLNNPRMSNDVPANGATVPPRFNVSGWALDLAASSGTGVDGVHVWAYPNPGSGAAPIFLGAASYGSSRPDVGMVFAPQFTNSGYTLTTPNLAPGPYQIIVFVHSSVSGSFDNATTLNVSVLADPLMAVDAPVPGLIFRPFVVSGWAIDLGAASGSGVDAVHVWAYSISGVPAQFLGAATSGLARPDVGNLFGARFTNSGYRLTVSSLSPGIYDLVVFAHSTATNTFNNARVVRVAVP